MVPGTCREGDDGGRTKPLINLNLVGLGGGIQEFLIEDAQGVAPNPTGDALGCVPSTPHPSASLPMHATHWSPSSRGCSNIFARAAAGRCRGLGGAYARILVAIY